MSYSLLLKLSVTLQCSVLGVEYPGYGVYQSEQADAETLLQNAHSVLNYLTGQLGYKESDLILVGRSMGSGPAVNLAVKCN